MHHPQRSPRRRRLCAHCSARQARRRRRQASDRHLQRSVDREAKVKPDGARLETEFEVDQNRNGVTWKVTIHRNGARAVSTRATTHAPSGSFSVKRRLANGPGSDRISARATSPSGEVCTAAVSA